MAIRGNPRSIGLVPPEAVLKQISYSPSAPVHSTEVGSTELPYVDIVQRDAGHSAGDCGGGVQAHFLEPGFTEGWVGGILPVFLGT